MDQHLSLFKLQDDKLQDDKLQDDLLGPFPMGQVTFKKLLAEQKRQSTCPVLEKAFLSLDIAENDLATG